MEFNEKLQALRKQKGLTQEELAQALFVSRTAISKWESGRGYPNIESLKAMAQFFHVTVDALLSGDELLTLAEADSRRRTNRDRDLVFGLLDCCAVMFLFLPFFGQSVEGVIREVSLLQLEHIAPWLYAAYFAVVIGMTLVGVVTLAMQNCQASFWVSHKSQLSLICNGAGTLLFILSRQPYGAAFLFVFLAIKTLMLVKRR